MSEVAVIDTLRTLANGSISGVYAAVGVPTSYPSRVICFTNNTDGDMYFTDDPTRDEIFVAKGAFKLFDVTTNQAKVDGFFAFPARQQFYVKQSSAPSTGSVYIEVIYGS